MDMLCANKICIGIATEPSGLCLSCELRYNTTQEKFEKRLIALLNRYHPSRSDLHIFFSERKRRSDNEIYNTRQGG